MPHNETATYIRTACATRSHMTETDRVRITAGGNRMFYAGEKSTPIASIETIKMHWNSVMSTEGAKHVTIDLEDFFLKTHSLEHECVTIILSTMPSDFAAQCDLHEQVDESGCVRAKVSGRIHSLSQVGRLAYEDLKSHLSQHGCNPVEFIPGLWKHESNGISFALVVDDFGVKSEDAMSLKHLIAALQDKCEITTNVNGNSCIEVALNWNPKASEKSYSMPGYLPR